MKYLKTYEETWNQDEGSYVVMTDDRDKYTEWFENNVGQITKMYYPGAWFQVEYNCDDPEIQKYIDIMNSKASFHFQSILFKSKSKEEAEEFIETRKNMKKYNL